MSIEKAARYAAKAHEGQFRKNSKTPYVIHLQNVQSMVAGFLGEDHELYHFGRIVAWLHDTVEDDPNTTIEILVKEFSRAVARNVYFLTDPPRYTGSRMERKDEVCRKMQVAPMIARIVKCCDVLDNLRDVEVLEPDFRELYIKEKAQLYEALAEGLDEAEEPEEAAINALGKRIKELTSEPKPLDLSAFNPK